MICHLTQRNSLQSAGFPVPPGGASDKVLTCQCRRHKTCKLDSWVRKIPWRRAWQPTPVFWLGESHDRGSWWATIHSVTKSFTWLKQLSTHTCTHNIHTCIFKIMNNFIFDICNGHSSGVPVCSDSFAYVSFLTQYFAGSPLFPSSMDFFHMTHPLKSVFLRILSLNHLSFQILSEKSCPLSYFNPYTPALIFML